MIPELQDLSARRLQLGTLPTPVVPFPTSAEVSVDLKRDDLIGDQLTGTKARALSFIVDKALQDGVTDLITIGEPTSNQCRSVAVLAARHGMKCHLLLRASLCRPNDQNLAALEMFGAHSQSLTEEEWPLHGMAAKRLMSRIRREGGKALFIPFGCGGLPGVLGIIDLFREIVELHGGQCPYSHILIPTGSGSTLFGLDLAVQALGISPAPRLIGVSVSQDAASLYAHGDRLYQSVSSAWGLDLARSERVSIDESWKHLSPSELLEQLNRVVDTYGMMPDPLYVLRTILALERLISDDSLDPQSRILVLVSGACRTFHAMRQRASET